MRQVLLLLPLWLTIHALSQAASAFSTPARSMKSGWWKIGPTVDRKLQSKSPRWMSSYNPSEKTQSPKAETPPQNEVLKDLLLEPAPKEKPPRRPLARFLYNYWYVITAPFPDLRKVARKRDSDSKFVVSLRLQDGLAALCIYLGVGVFSYHYVFEHWSIVDSLYFTCVCFSTVGYGDLSPTSVASKVFTCLFGLCGIALLGAAVASIGSRLVQAEIDAVKAAQRQSRKRMYQVYDHMPNILKKMRRASKKEKAKVMIEAKKTLRAINLPQFSSGLRIFLKTIQYVLQSLAVVGFGGLVVGYFEGWHWIDSLYFSLITASTIGLGDFAPVTRNGRLAAVFMIPMSVAAAGEILASIGMALVERRQKKIFKSQLNKGLDMDHLKAMDTNLDGKVEREEYVLFMLMEMGLVSKDEIYELWSQFDRLDVTKSGFLEQDDLALMARLRSASLWKDEAVPEATTTKAVPEDKATTEAPEGDISNEVPKEGN